MEKKKDITLKKLIKDTLKTLSLTYSANAFCFIAVSFITLLQGVIPVVQLSIGKYVMDSIFTAIKSKGAGNDIKYVAFWVVLELLTFMLSVIIDNSKGYFSNMLGNYMTLKVNEELFAKTASLDAAFFENSDFYDLLNKARQGAGQRPIQMLEQLFSIAQNSVTLLGLMSLIFAFNPVILALLIVTTIPTIMVEMNFSKKIYTIFENRVQEVRKKDYTGWLMTDKWAFKEMRLFMLGKHFLNMYRQICKKHIDQDKSVNLKRNIANIIVNSLLMIIYYSMYGFVVYSTILNKITIGSMTMYTGSKKQIQGRLRSLLQSFSSLYESDLYISNLFMFFEIKSNLVNGLLKDEKLPNVKKSIEFKNVTFKYPGTEKYVLKNINLRIEEEQSVALVGLNGSGKTTLIKLLCRFYDPTEGVILINDIDIKEYDINTLRKKISTIFQDYVRYEMNVLENIAIGNIEQIDNIEFIEECAKKGGAYDFISKMPNKFQEQLGRVLYNGCELSIGQWQKIALARAFMGDRDILILDEPTASLDPESEYEIFKKFSDLTKGKLSIVISHRFSTVRMADNIIVLKDGSIAEAGNHAYLMGTNGEYSRLYNLQAEAYQDKNTGCSA
jgi:ABC-type multidrug transport system fused ATPase/permease subunit